MSLNCFLEYPGLEFGLFLEYPGFEFGLFLEYPGLEFGLGFPVKDNSLAKTRNKVITTLARKGFSTNLAFSRPIYIYREKADLFAEI